tara:strand:- start:143 stop:595 length:453 start_codon:yes stop_codon:yes gene_type:complete
MTEEIRNKIVSMDVPQRLKDLCVRDDFLVQSTRADIKPRNSSIWQIEATDIQVEVYLGGVHIRAQDLYSTISKQSSSYYYLLDYQIPKSERVILYEDCEHLDITVGDLEPLKSIWNIQMDSFALVRIIIETLCDLSIPLELLEEHFASES